MSSYVVCVRSISFESRHIRIRFHSSRSPIDQKPKDCRLIRTHTPNASTHADNHARTHIHTHSRIGTTGFLKGFVFVRAANPSDRMSADAHIACSHVSNAMLGRLQHSPSLQCPRRRRRRGRRATFRAFDEAPHREHILSMIVYNVSRNIFTTTAAASTQRVCRRVRTYSIIRLCVRIFPIKFSRACARHTLTSAETQASSAYRVRDSQRSTCRTRNTDVNCRSWTMVYVRSYIRCILEIRHIARASRILIAFRRNPVGYFACPTMFVLVASSDDDVSSVSPPTPSESVLHNTKGFDLCYLCHRIDFRR